MKSFVIQTLRLIVFFSVGVLILGWIYETAQSSRDKSRYQPPGRIVDVHGLPMHIRSMGRGGPTVVMDAAIGMPSLDWHQIQEKVALKTRVCTFDRPGYGWSQPVSGSRTSFNIAFELHELLKAAGEEPPYILVGHAFGALNMRYFASLYPNEVAGLILLDPFHEEMEELLPKPRLSVAERFWDQVPLFFSKLGIHRYLSRHFVAKHFPDLPLDIQLPFQSHHSRPQTLETAYRENLSLSESLQMMREEGAQKLPLVVITSGGSAFDDPSLYQKILQIHQNMAGSSPSGRHIVMDESSHFIHHNQPGVVIDEIFQMLQK